jgi:ribosomal protein L40E
VSSVKQQRIDAGLCIDCGARARPDRVRCQRCGEHDNNRHKRRYYAMTPNAKPRDMRCGFCGARGHDRRRCTKAEAA